jgi:hypothetical protein
MRLSSEQIDLVQGRVGKSILLQHFQTGCKIAYQQNHWIIAKA